MTTSQARFWPNVGVVVTGMAAAQAIPLLGSLVVARLFAPSEFGVFAAWLGMVSLASVMITARLEMALVLEPDGDRRRVGAVCTAFVVFANGLLLALLTGLVALISPRQLRSVDTTLLVAFAPAAVLVALTQTWQSWAAADGRFVQLSWMRIAQAAAVTGLQIAAGVLSPSGTAIAVAYGLGVLLGGCLALCWLPPGRLPPAHALRSFLSRHRAFPLWSLPGGAINAGAAQLPLLIVASRFGTDVAGLLAVAQRTLGAPIGLLGAAVLDVFKRKAAASFRQKGNCRSDYIRIFQVLSLGSLAVMPLLAVFSERLFAFAFGETWRHAGNIAAWLMPLFALRFVASPLSYVFFIAGKQRMDLLWQIALLTMTLAALSSSPRYDIALQLYSAGYSVLYLVYLCMSFRFSLGQGPTSR